MIELCAYGLIALMGVFVMPRWSFMPYDVPRQSLISLGAFVLLAFVMKDAPDRMASWAVLLSPMLGWWVIASLLSRRPDMSFERAIQFFSCMTVGILAAQAPASLIGLLLIAVAGTLGAIYGILQWHFGILIMKQIESVTNADEACGFTRNVNFQGPWLVLTLLFTLKLLEATSAEIGLTGQAGLGLAAGIQAYAIWCSRCRTAFLGLGAAFAYFGFMEAGGYMAVLGAVLFSGVILGAVKGKSYKLFRTKSLRERKAFFRIFFEAIRRRPMVGYGFDVVKTLLPGLTRHLNETMKGKLLDPKNYEAPIVRKAHNDIMQHLCDVGAIGLALALGTLVGLVNRPDPFFMGIVVVFLVMGLTFHQMYWLPTQCLFWLSWGSMVDPWPQVSAPPEVLTFFMVILGLGIFMTVIRTQVGDVFHWLGNWAPESHRVKWLLRSARWKPGSIAMLQGANELARMKHIPASCEMLYKLLDRYDGDTRMWIITSCLGELYLSTGSLTLARVYHEESVAYWPEWAYSLKRLAQIRKLETQAGKK